MFTVKIIKYRIGAVFQCLLKKLTLSVRVLLTLELMWLNHSWWTTHGIHYRKKTLSYRWLKMARYLVAIYSVILLLLFSCQTSLSTCTCSQKLAYLSRFHSTMKVICMRTDYAQNTCQTLKFQFQQQVTPFCLHCAAHESSCCSTSCPGGPGAKCSGLVEWLCHW